MCLIGFDTINIPEIILGVRGFMVFTVNNYILVTQSAMEKTYTVVPDITWSPPAKSWLCFICGTPCAYAKISVVNDFTTDLHWLEIMPMLAFPFEIIIEKQTLAIPTLHFSLFDLHLQLLPTQLLPWCHQFKLISLETANFQHLLCNLFWVNDPGSYAK